MCLRDGITSLRANIFIYLIDFKKLFNRFKNNAADIEKQLELLKTDPSSGISRIIKENKIAASEIAKTEIAISKDPGSNAEIHGFIKSPLNNKNYIPGSSLKGSLRTAILWNYLKTDVSILKETLKDGVVNNLKGTEDKELGMFNQSVMRFLQISDSLNTSEGRVMEVKIASPYLGGSKLEWKGSGKNTEDIRHASSLYYECVEAGKDFDFDVSIPLPKNLLDKKIGKTQANAKKALISIDGIINSCNTFSKYQIEQDCEYINRFKLTKYQVAEFYKDSIIAVFDSLKPNECMLHIGWGAGWLSKTFTSIVKDEYGNIFNYNKRFFGDRGDISASDFPKTRRFVIQNNEPMYSFGWVKLIFPNGVAQNTSSLKIDIKLLDAKEDDQKQNKIPAVSSGVSPKEHLAEKHDNIKDVSRTVKKGDFLEAKIVKIAGYMAEVELIEKIENIRNHRIRNVRLLYNHNYKNGDMVRIKVEKIYNNEITCRMDNK